MLCLTPLHRLRDCHAVPNTVTPTAGLPCQDAETPIAEDEFRRRRPHNHFREHIDAEKTVIKAGKGTGKCLSTCVLRQRGICTRERVGVTHLLQCQTTVWAGVELWRERGKGREREPEGGGEG